MGRKLHYKTTRFHGLPISIENRKGSVRHWTDRNGEAGKTKMLMPYGYVRGTIGADGDHVDVFLGPNRLSRRVFVVNQRQAHVDLRKFDEHKCLLGFDSKKEARAAYEKHYDRPGFIGSIVEMTIERFKRWLFDGKKKTKPVRKAWSIRSMHELRKGGPFIGPRGGKWADAKHTIPWKLEVRTHKHITGRKEHGQHTFHARVTEDGDVRVSEHEEGKYGPTMPKESVKHFVNDLAGKVELPKHASHAAINAVIAGKAKLLGKGDDGIAFKVGGDVVKVSTTVPFQPTNPGHRTPERAANMLKEQAELGNKLADAGVPGIQRSEYVRHGDKGFQIKPYVEIPEKLTLEHLDQAQDALIGMHDAGYVLNDQVQIGLSGGKAVLFDIGKAGPRAKDDKGQGMRSRVKDDMDRLARLYSDHGHVFKQRNLSPGDSAWSAIESKFWGGKFLGSASVAELQQARKDVLAAAELRRVERGEKEIDTGFALDEIDFELEDRAKAKKSWRIRSMPLQPRAEQTTMFRSKETPMPKLYVPIPERQLLVVADLLKGRRIGGKYIRRVPYTDPKTGKRRYRYFYRESAAARGAVAGETVRLGERLLKVLEVDEQGTVKFREGDRTFSVSPNEWGRTLARHYGQRYHDWAAKRAHQSINAVLRHVPRDLLLDLKGATDKERLEELRTRVPHVYAKLQASFRRAGIDPFRAKHVIKSSLERRGWEPEARAAVIGSVIDKKIIGYRQLIRSSENLAGGNQVTAGHVASAAELRAPGGNPERFKDEVDKTAKSAEGELATLSKLLSAAHDSGDPQDAAKVLETALGSDALQKLQMLMQAFPGLQVGPVADEARETLAEVPSVAPRPQTRTEGAETHVYVAGEGGQPRALKARYKLVEASEAVASHDPKTFSRRAGYPEDVQERAYHRDKAEQAKVIRNAQKLNPAFVINTNPDAVNGPPMMTKDGIVLGGNSRTMSMQRAYLDHPDKAEQMRSYLAEHAHEVGLTADDVKAMKNPILVRVVDDPTTGDAGPDAGLFGQGEPMRRKHTQRELQLLVRQMNESFTQGMDPRTMQVAMGRKLSDEALSSMANAMEEGESLSQFLASKRSEGFINQLMRAGIIDQRNASQYLKKGTKVLNADGKTLISRILVGRMVGDADLLSNTRPRMIENLARSTPFLVQAKAYGEGYDIGQDMGVALSALNDLQHRVEAGALPALDPKMPEQRFNGLFNYFTSLFDDDHPVVDNPRARQLLEVMIRKPGSQQMANVFKDYAKQASQNPEGQASMFGPAPKPEEVLAGVVKDKLGKSIVRAHGQRYRVRSMANLRKSRS